MPTILHVADVHLGARRYGLDEIMEDVESAFDQIVEWALREKPDALVVAGDFFDKPRPDNRVLAYAIRRVRELAERGVRVVFALGEHDTPPRRDRPAASVVAEVVGQGVYAPTPAGSTWSEIVASMTVAVNGVNIAVTPFFKSSPSKRREALEGFLQALRRRVEAGGVWVLVAHAGIEGFTYPDDAVLEPAVLPPVAYAALGHVHKRRVVAEGAPAPFAYPGSLVPLTIDEVIDQERVGYRRGALLIDLMPGGEVSIDEVPVEEPRRHVVVSTTPARAEEDVASALRKAGVRGERKPLVHLILYMDPGERLGARQGVRGLVASLSRKFNAIVRVARLHYRDAPSASAGVAGAEGGGEAPSEVEVVASIVGDESLARALVALKEALLGGDSDAVEAIVEEVVGDRYSAVWRRLLGRSVAQPPRGAGLRGWL